MNKGKQFWGGVLTGLAAAFFLVLLVFFGSRLHALITGRGTSSSMLIDDKVQSKLDMINDTIDKYYVEYDDKLSKTSRTEGMYKGIVESLGDPYSEYYTYEEFNTAMEEDEGRFEGIGVEIAEDQETGDYYVAGFLPNSAAQAAGMEIDDIFYAVDGDPVEDETMSEMVKRIRGEKGTTVELEMIRGEDREHVTFTVERAVVQVRSVSSNMMDNHVGYMRISSFDQVTYEQFMNELESLQDGGMKKMILDLRSNPGGDVDVTLKIADEILGEARIVYTKDKEGHEKDYDSDEKKKMDIPIVVLVNGYSASASEILTGALKDNKAAKVVGTTTFGKGIMQTILPFSDGTAIKLTSHRYYTPSGVNIQGVGIEPDVEIAFDNDAYNETGKDNQLDEAERIIQEME